MDRPAHICARLIREGAVPRDELPELDLPEIRGEVEQRLARTGLQLATSAYSEYVGIRPSSEVTSDPAFDAASNAGLRADACALLVALWARLVLQKRTASDTRQVPDQAEMFARESAAAARSYTPQVRTETILREFGSVIGSRTNLKRLVSQLRRLGFIGGRGEILEAGPLLELGIDGERMVAFIRRGVLAQLLEERDHANQLQPEQPDAGERVLEALRTLGGVAAIRPLEEQTGYTRGVLRKLLRALEESGQVERRGERAGTRYHLTEES
jgi:DNA-binding transcriptional ArsR family regulator